MTREELGKMIPIKPPTVKSKIKPNAHRIAGDHLILPLCRIASELSIFSPVGIIIIIVSDVKYAWGSTSMPTINM
jgi:hypothetical protein